METFFTLLGILLAVIVISLGVTVLTFKRAERTGIANKYPWSGCGIVFIFPVSMVLLLISVAVFFYYADLLQIISIFPLLLMLALMIILSSSDEK